MAYQMPCKRGVLTTYDTWDDLPNTLPETDPLHLKMDGWKTIFFLFGWLILGRCELLDLKSVKKMIALFMEIEIPKTQGLNFCSWRIIPVSKAPKDRVVCSPSTWPFVLAYKFPSRYLGWSFKYQVIQVVTVTSLTQKVSAWFRCFFSHRFCFFLKCPGLVGTPIFFSPVRAVFLQKNWVETWTRIWGETLEQTQWFWWIWYDGDSWFYACISLRKRFEHIFFFGGTGTTTQNQPTFQIRHWKPRKNLVKPSVRQNRPSLGVCWMASWPEKGWLKKLKNWIPQISNEQNQGGATETSFFFKFSPRFFGGFHDPIWRAHLFQMGWFNHQLEI